MWNCKAQQTITSFFSNHPLGVAIIWWATATGKSSLSIALAQADPCIEIISADSRQIYRYMDIGTDKVSKQLREEFPHHQIDIIDPDTTYTAGQWKEDTTQIINQIHARGNKALIVWWTGLYIDTIYKNFSMPEVAPDMERRATMMQQEEQQPWRLHKQLTLVDPDEAHKHHPHSTRYILRALEIYEKTDIPKSKSATQLPVQRPLLLQWLRREKLDTNCRINARIKEMIDQWLVNEVQWLLDRWYTLQHTAMNGIGYKEIIGYLHNEYDLDKAIELLKRNSHRYAKRQRSRFRRYIAEGKQIPKEHVTYGVEMLT